MNRLFYISILLLLSINGLAQDIHFSQFYNAPLQTNPAMTGIFGGDVRFVGNFRHQWASVPVPYTTFSGSFEHKLVPKLIKTNGLAAGLLINQDQAGDSRLSLTNIMASAAYAQAMNDQNFVSIGFQVGIGQRRIDMAALTFDSQFNGDIFDPNLPTQENLPILNFVYPDMNAGINWHFQLPDLRTWVNAGASLAHLNTPRQSFFENDDVRLSRKLAFSTDASFPISAKLDLQPALLYQRQNTYQELVYGTNVKYHLTENAGNEMGLLFGGWHRWGDAIAFFAGLDYTTLSVGISYDINISPFNVATNGNGGPELSVIYTIAKVKGMESYRSCPIF